MVESVGMVTQARRERVKEVAKERFSDVVVVLEDIYDPHNAAASFRNCDAFGVQNIHLVFEKQESFNPKKLGKSSSSSANKWLDFRIWRSTNKCIEFLRREGYTILATVLDEEEVPLWEVDFTRENLAILFGNEHEGLSVVAQKLADEKVWIPMFGFVQSLNLSVSVGIVLYELRRQRRRYKKDAGFAKNLYRRWLLK